MLAPLNDDPRRRQGLKDMRAHPENWGRRTNRISAGISARPPGEVADSTGLKAKSRSKKVAAGEGKNQ